MRNRTTPNRKLIGNDPVTAAPRGKRGQERQGALLEYSCQQDAGLRASIEPVEQDFPFGQVSLLFLDLVEHQTVLDVVQDIHRVGYGGHPAGYADLGSPGLLDQLVDSD